MEHNSKIAVKCDKDRQKCDSVIQFARKDSPGKWYSVKAECIDLANGCHCNEKYYFNDNYKIISYEEFVNNYLTKELEYEIY